MLDKIEQDLKAAMLAGDKAKAETLKGIKNALQYEAVNRRLKPPELDAQTIQSVLSREAKKRAEAAEVYRTAGEANRMDQELAEKAVIDGYLPEQLAETEVEAIVKQEISKSPGATSQDMGRIIGAVRVRTAGGADGGLIAKLVKQNLEQT